MINTYQTSLAAPPVPPRLNRSIPVLMPGPLPSRGHSKSLIRFLVGVVLLHLLLSVGGFIYLYHTSKKEKPASAEGKAALLLSEKQETSYKALARMIVKHTAQDPTSGYLQWDTKHSVLRNINYYRNSWLTILEPGDYFVFSRVTFSKGNSKLPLASMVKLRKNEAGDEKTVMRAYCSLESYNRSASNPQLCTATQGEVITLEKGNQLSVWVQDLSLVDYNEEATAFGMYKV
ncbi:CD40 ligand [Thunnus thynnus]|uniref:CD40 ligand n=1 Tax=Thunnus maccoyii TaxID=8240 RepID=UPI001C4BA936|nr:CD40 ligand [Thunnus maccoyii]|eukprot:superscaffoldBa00000519_g5376